MAQSSLDHLETILRDDLARYTALNRASVARFQERPHADSVLLDALQALDDLTPGLLVLLGYRMTGHDDVESIAPIARAVLMSHLYAQDMAIAPDLSIVSGMHAAQITITQCGLPPEQRLTIMRLLNKTLLLYAQAKAHPVQDSDKVKTCYAAELFGTPLHIGLVAGQATDTFIESLLPFMAAGGKARVYDGQDADDYREQAYARLASPVHPIPELIHQQLLLILERP